MRTRTLGSLISIGRKRYPQLGVSQYRFVRREHGSIVSMDPIGFALSNFMTPECVENSILITDAAYILGIPPTVVDEICSMSDLAGYVDALVAADRIWVHESEIEARATEYSREWYASKMAG